MKIPPKSKKALPPPPVVTALISLILKAPDDELTTVLKEIDTWKWPRTDLNAWIKILNRFDDVMDSIIREYNVDKLQLVPFSKSTKELLSEILRFERLLLEYSTNRKTFSSYDRLNNLLSSSDLEIVILALNVLLRPSQQYSSQQPVSHLSISTTRLQSLAKRWPHLREHGIGLLELASDQNGDLDGVPLDAREVNFTFYNTITSPTADKKPENVDTVTVPRNATVSGPTLSSDSIQIRLDEHTITSQPVMNVLQDTIQAYSVPDSECFELLCRIRAAASLASGKKADRENLLVIRLLAIAIYGHTHSESQAMSALFLYEPDLIAHIAELLQSDKGVPIPVQTAAISALDALARYKSKIQEVLTAVNAGVNHGILLALVRTMVVKVADLDSQLPHSFIEALLSFITYLASHASGGNMVVSAGLIPLLVQIVENKNSNRLPVISKTMQLLDNVIYSFSNAFSLFCASRGVEILVERIEHEIDHDIENHATSHQPYALSGLGELPIKRVAVLKHMLRSMHRMMQSSGTAEGLRSLIDMSLLKSIKKVVLYRGLFGPSVFPLAINIMSSFVHNEPTSLAIIQESGLPSMFYQAIENGIEPAIEVIQAIPNAIGALCLNEVGQAQLAKRPSIIPAIISIFTSERHLKVLIDKENAVVIGTAVDELIRHHPSLKNAVFEALKSTLSHLENIGMAYTPSDDIKRWYQLIPLSQVPNLVADVTMQDSTSSCREIDDLNSTEAEGLRQSDDEDDLLEEKSHVNAIVNYIDVLGRFLDGFFQHPVHCRDFVLNTDGLKRIGRLTALPCLPYDFANNVASDSMVQVLRTMAEVATNETLSQLIEFVKDSLSDTQFLWGSEQENSKLLALVDLSDQESVAVNQQFRNLVTLYIRTTLLSDVFATAGQPQSRATAGLWQTLMNSIPRQVLADLGALHRAGAWESSILAAGLRRKGVELPDYTVPGLEGVPSLVSATLPVTHDAAASSSVSALTEGNATPSSTSSKGPVRDGPQEWNAAALARIVQGIPNTLAPFFQAIVKMFHSRRNTDTVYKKQIIETSKVVANVMLKHFNARDHEDKVALYGYYSSLLNLVGRLLIDDRTNTSTLHTVQVFAFYQVGGFDGFFNICLSLISDIDELVKVSEDARTDLQKKQLLQAYGTIELMLQLVHPTISAKTLFDSSQTHMIITRDKGETDADFFEPHNFLVKLRFTALPTLRRLWEASWLAEAPVGVSRSVVRCMLEVVNGESEDGKSDNGDGSVPPVIPRAGPSEAHMRLLMDMGFPRSAVERALVHANNDINSATEYLLSLPFPLPPDPEPAIIEAESVAEAMTTEESPEGSVSNTDEGGSPLPPTIDEDINLPVPSHGKSGDEWRRLLDEAREPLKVNISKQSLALIDQHLSLLFDLHIVFTKNSKHQEEAVNHLVDDISSFSTYAYDVQEQPLANRCRLLALVLCEKPSSLGPDLRNTLMERLLALLLTTRDSEHPPKWLAAHLLVTEALFTLADEPRTISVPKEGETIVPGPIAVGPQRPEARSIVFDFCLQLLTNDDLPADELLSVLRLFVLLTRDRQMAAKFIERDGLSSLFKRMRKSAVTGGSSYVASVLRHVIEDIPIIQGIMQQTIKSYFSQPRRVVDLPTYVKNSSAIALRDMDLFIHVTNNMCLVESPFASPHIRLQGGVQQTNKRATGPEISADMQIDNPQTSPSCSVPNKSVEVVVHLLVNEVMTTAKLIEETPSPSTLDSDSLSPSKSETNDQSSSPVDVQDKHQYLCFVMQCLTELLFSYDSCKIAFLSYSSKKRSQPQPKELSTKLRTTMLHFLLSDIITYSTINPASNPKLRNRVALCSWAMNVVGALCADTSVAQETKDISSDLLLVRKFVLETISRAIKEFWSTTESTEARYGRLLALADLCYRLLTVRVNPNTRKQQQDDIPTHLAKIMLEKNFVATLTNALSEVDLNYPNVRNLIASVLRPLEYLTKVAMKMSKASGKNKEDVTQDEAQSSTTEDEDEAMEDASPREVTPDLYRNSALGMYGGEMDDRPYTDDEDMDEDEEDQNVEMDYGEGTGSEETSASEAESDDEGDIGEGSPVSGDGWHEDEEDEEHLVQNPDDEDEDEEVGHVGDDRDNVDDEGDEDDDDVGMIWEDIPQPEALGMILENADEDQGLGVSIQINHEEDEPELASDEEELLGQGHLNNDDMIELGNAVITASNQAPGLFIQRRFPRTVGRGSSRNVPSAPEAITHPLLLDVSTQNRSNFSTQNRNLRNPQRFISSGPLPSMLHALDQVFGDGSLQAIQHFVHQGPGFGGMFHIQLGAMFSQPPRRLLPASVRQERTPRTNHRQGREFDPLLTIQRWSEEMRILHGDFVNERATKLTNHLLIAMLPAALEAQKQAKLKAQEEAKRKEEEEKEKERQEAEEEAKKAEEAEEDLHRGIDVNPSDSDAVQESTANPTAPDILTSQSSATEPVAAERIQGEALSVNVPSFDAVMEEIAPSRLDQDSEMADITESTPEAPVALASSSEEEQLQPQSTSGASTNREARITVIIHGSPVDITDTGIDPTFLEALPDDMREEVLNQHVRDRQASRVERPPDSLISAEFLDALPPDIRAEIIQQEAMERTRRQTEETASRPPIRAPAEIDAASFIASLDPSLRQAVLLDQDDNFLQTLPPHMIAEAGVYRDEAHARHNHSSRNPVRPIATAPPVKKHPQHDAIMLLERAGVAILVRLLFYPQVLKKGLLFKVLVNLCENIKTRTELFNLLLSILQDGTGDLTAVDKSFAQMTVKSRESKLQTPKAKQRSTDFIPPFGMQISQIEAVPDLIAQRCLEALTYIVNANESSSLFFLTEQEMSAGLRKLSTKKGKGKEKQMPQTHYPLVLLLNLLDRQTLLRTPAILESVVGLLATITRPLTGLKEPSKMDEDVMPSTSAQDNVDNQPNPSSVQLPEAVDNNTVDPPPAGGPAAPPSEQPPTSGNIPEAKTPLNQPPVVPHVALRLIVNILTTGECSSRTFQQSLALIQNLSYIPDARDVIALELKTKAQDCGQTLYFDLDELAIALQDGQGQIIASSVAAKFSPASSTQAKLLRVLKTIDYMYTPKPITTVVGMPASKEDIEKVQAIYESFRFTPLWRRLGDCLSTIGENPDTEHIATVLLPLIESLMVVCKFVGSKSHIPRALRVAASPQSPTTPKESMEDLFISFTDAHRKILNLMVRNNPSLMSGSFSLLVNNSRVLDFDNKRNYFNQQLHRRPHGREHYGTLQLNVRRARVFEDSFLYLQRKTGEQIKFGKLNVRFYDEEGVDAGGLTREWFQILARQMFDPNYALFQPCAADKLTYQPNKASCVNPEHLSFFKFVGRVIGKAIYDGRLLDAYFARSLYRQILGKPVDYKDVEWIDPEYYNSLCWILENDPSPLELTFSIEADEFGVNKIVPLKEKGETTQVTQENKREYVQLSAQYRLYSSIKDQIESLLGGFYEIIPKYLITIFNEQELELLISGTPDIDVDEWRAATEYNGYTASDPNIVWWWRALKSFNREERAKVLSFATGTSRVPLNGFLDLQGVQGVQKFSIHRAYGDTDRLPQAHTCFNQIDLPQYTSYEMLRQQLLLAINEGGEGFGFS